MGRVIVVLIAGLIITVSCLAISTCSIAWADDGTAHMTVDNHYNFYISDTESALGDFLMSSYTIGSQQDWQNAESGTGAVKPGYLHIVATISKLYT